MQPNAERHEPTGRDEGHADGFMPEEHRQYRSNEWRGGEVSAGPRRTQAPERKDEQHEAQPVTKEAQHEGGADPWQGRERSGEGKADGQVDSAGSGPLEGSDLEWVAGRDFLGEVVVDGPAEAGRRNQ